MNFVSLLKSLKKRILGILRIVGTIQISFLLSLFYYLIFGPFALVYKLFRFFEDQQRIKKTYWIPREQAEVTKQRLTKQY